MYLVKSDSLLFIAALSFALHIIFIDIFMKELNSPFIFGFITLKATGVCWSKMHLEVDWDSLLEEQVATSR